MQRVVFFGMNGGFSTATLAALVASGLKPVLVVRGEARSASSRGVHVEVSRARGSWLDLIGLGKKRAKGGDAEVAAGAGALDVFEAAGGASGDERFADGDLAEAARKYGIDLVSTTDANALRVRLQLARVSPDALVIAGFPHLLSGDVLRLAKRGALNLHPGRLPAERGPSPVFWAMKAGRTKLTYTVHLVDQGEDSGDVVATGELAFEPGLDIELVHTRCARVAAPLLLRAVRGLLQGELVRTPQAKEGRGRCPRPGFRDGLIDPTLSAEAVYTFVGGCARVHSLFAEHGGDRFFLREAVSYDPAATLPFEYMLTGDRMVVRCNPGVVELVLKEQGALFTAEYAEHA